MRLTALSFVSATALLAGLGTAQADIVIGLGTATTGPVAALGEQSVYGAKQAVADINAKGGVLGQQLVLKVGDDACDPRQAVAVANQFARDQVAAVVGHLCSGASIPAADVYQEEGVVMVTPTATNPLLTARGFSNIFRVCVTTSRAWWPATIWPRPSRARTSRCWTTSRPMARAWPTWWSRR